jgi:beta-glucosidase
MKYCAVSLNLLLVLWLSGCDSQRFSLSEPAQCSDSVIEAKIDALMADMTLEEKAGQMTQTNYCNDFDELRKGAIGSFLNVSDINRRNEYQKVAVEESRLGIPLIFGFDVIHGHRTIFPVPLAEAASWDLSLMEQTAAIAAKEAAACGVDWTFSPMVDIARDPRWGRVVEGAGEDPYLGSLIARAKVRGYQGNDLSAPDTIAACLKHFAVYGAAQAGRDYSTTEVPERTIRDVYLPPFKAGVDEGASTLMSGFNDLNGIPATGNKFLLTDILRDEWGFDGFVVSDYLSVEQMIDHGFAKDGREAAVRASGAGVDMEMASKTYFSNLPEMVRAGEFPEKVLDDAVRRILRVKYRLGLFEHPYADPELKEKSILLPAHRSLARKAAAESMVLLKNETGILPLEKTVKSIALIGPLSDNRRGLIGTWAPAARDEDVVTVMDGLKGALGEECQINYARGCDVKGDSTAGFSEALAAAENSDIVILAVGEDADCNGEGHSVTKLNLPGVQLELVKEIQKTGKPVVMVLFAGRPLTIDWELENLPAILLAWHPGTEGGNALADVLLGNYNPAGKITVTFPRNVGQIPLYYSMKNTGRPMRPDDLYTSRYRDCPNTPLLPFGYGLSYTTFSYSNLKVENDCVDASGVVKVSAEITNTGSLAGCEVVQLYVRDLVGSVTRPVKELKGFKRLQLEPGESETVVFELSNEDLKFYDINMEYTAEPGDFDVWIGPNSAEGLKGSFTLL